MILLVKLIGALISGHYYSNTKPLRCSEKSQGRKCRNSIKLRTYIKFKFDHSLEEYLFYIPDTRWIKALSRLRISSHMLEIERGRHVKPQKIPLEQRTCQRCTLISVDDGIHFLITCSYFATQRTSLLAGKQTTQQ